MNPDPHGSYYLAQNVPAGHVYPRLDVGVSLQVVIHLCIQLSEQRTLGMRGERFMKVINERERYRERQRDTDKLR